MLVDLEFGVVGFSGEWLNGIPGEKPLGARREQPNTQHRYDIWPESKSGHMGGKRCALIPSPALPP